MADRGLVLDVNDFMSRGKTMVGRILGRFLFSLDILPTDKLIEVQRSDLVAQHIGETALKTREKINEARGGILCGQSVSADTQGGVSKD